MNTARFDTRIRKDQKELFEEAAYWGGFRSLTDFIISAALEKAKLIMEERSTILASRKDREVFFKALVNPPKPNEKLKAAAQLYKSAIRE
jgi:uncharacterized protein (DUF1778 family)